MDIILTDPVLLPVGSITMQSSVRALVEVHQKWIILEDYPAFNPVHYAVDTPQNTTSPSTINEVTPIQYATQDQAQLTSAVGNEWAMNWLCRQSSCCRYLVSWQSPTAEKSGESENKRFRWFRSHQRHLCERKNMLMAGSRLNMHELTKGTANWPWMIRGCQNKFITL